MPSSAFQLVEHGVNSLPVSMPGTPAKALHPAKLAEQLRCAALAITLDNTANNLRGRDASNIGHDADTATIRFHHVAAHHGLRRVIPTLDEHIRTQVSNQSQWCRLTEDGNIVHTPQGCQNTRPF